MKLDINVTISLKQLQTIAHPDDKDFQQVVERLYRDRLWENKSRDLANLCVSKFIDFAPRQSINAVDFINEYNDESYITPVGLNVVEMEQMVSTLISKLKQLNLLQPATEGYAPDRYSTNPLLVRRGDKHAAR